MSVPRRPGGTREDEAESCSLSSRDSSVFCSEQPPRSRQDLPPDSLLVNVGGRRFVLSQQSLAGHPETRLGRLLAAAAGRGPEAAELCDDASPGEGEFFFDRSAQMFEYIVHYYRTGRLHLMEQLCAASFLQEIEYWGLGELCLDGCCRDKYFRRKELSEALDLGPAAQEEDSQDEDFSGALCAAARQRLWDVMEKPGSSAAARAFGALSMGFVLLSIANMALISLELGSVDAPLSSLLEYVCMAWFTAEFLLRLLCVRDKRRFLRSVVNLIDVLSILPFYITLVVELAYGGSSELENVGKIVQILRLMRALRMLKLGRHSTGLKSLGMTIAQCYEEVGLLLLFLSVGISIFSALEYAVEHHVPDTTFTSVPSAWWWATTSMTTVGYGDVRPDTTIGKLVAFMCILSGILALALPIAIINDRFAACYFTLKIKEAALRQREALKKLTKNATNDSVANVNLRDIYARSIMEILRLKSRERASTRSSAGDDLW